MAYSAYSLIGGSREQLNSPDSLRRDNALQRHYSSNAFRWSHSVNAQRYSGRRSRLGRGNRSLGQDRFLRTRAYIGLLGIRNLRRSKFQASQSAVDRIKKNPINVRNSPESTPAPSQNKASTTPFNRKLDYYRRLLRRY